MSEDKILGLFEAYGIEMEYMIVDEESLDVKPIADKIIFAEKSRIENEVIFPDISWSNELALHVIEFKTSQPRSQITELHQEFQNHIKKVNLELKKYGASLLPTSMHPWMNPLTETKLWPHGNREIYQTYNKIFNCSGHGWANLQSVHLNLPFKNDQEFFYLHEAIRLILPLLPSLVASSPFVENKRGPALDTRLWFYKDNQKKFSSIIGNIIPESVKSYQDYCQKIFVPIEKDISPFDSQKILEPEWVNSRAAIARFDRMAIEIRLLDIQECPLADLSTTYFISEILKILTDKIKRGEISTERIPDQDLKAIFLQIIQEGDEYIINHPHYLSTLGFPQQKILFIRDLWLCFLNQIKSQSHEGRQDQEYLKVIEFILQKGNLARRMLQRLNELGHNGNDSIIASSLIPKDHLMVIYQELKQCLSEGTLFNP